MQFTGSTVPYIRPHKEQTMPDDKDKLIAYFWDRDILAAAVPAEPVPVERCAERKEAIRVVALERTRISQNVPKAPERMVKLVVRPVGNIETMQDQVQDQPSSAESHSGTSLVKRT